MPASQYQTANVPGVKAFPIEGIVLLLGFVIASAVLLSKPD